MNDDLRYIDERLAAIRNDPPYEDINTVQCVIADLAEMMCTLVYYIAKHNNTI